MVRHCVPFVQGVTQGPSHSTATHPGLLWSVSKRGQYSETMTQLAKFSGPRPANGRHYRVSAAACRQWADAGPLKLLPSKHSDVGPMSKRHRTRRQHVGVSCRRCRDVMPMSLCDRADELTRCTTYRRRTAGQLTADSRCLGGQN